MEGSEPARGGWRAAARRWVPPRFRRMYAFWREDPIDVHWSYAQEGEDLILRRFLAHDTPGVFVDVGAFHPWHLSNTYLFYRLGWRGINIDAMPGGMREFERWRPCDVNIEMLISDQEGEVTYYQFDQQPLNTCSVELAETYVAQGYRLVRTWSLRSRRLASVLDENLHGDTRIDFLTVDVEGGELAVLRSNDWGRYAPRVVLAEVLDFDIDRWPQSDLAYFMRSIGYRFVAKTFNTVFLMKE